jgi:hypothetical protein
LLFGPADDNRRGIHTRGGANRQTSIGKQIQNLPLNAYLDENDNIKSLISHYFIISIALFSAAGRFTLSLNMVLLDHHDVFSEDE